ncbi:hypothetical protein NIES593_04305 [Hydrococcus rivularis NIES-593]|uniref:Response regulatory domain-containing protein n=1 Tax=Hydrococcus rivularis NIES-593 TaxID=1921803 RepID=A0A1U7HPU1_9CYAN|nr:DUF3685 domain-containing protein [Hydrococcus rivularis]OKH25568.1 hypothetical protein NIES593_04305 [Hydrococcus rivularis NIES-593]
MSNRPIELLTIDDDPIFRLGLATALEAFDDIRVIAQADSMATALARLAEKIPDLVILEPAMPDGWQLCRQTRQDYPDLPIFLLSATTDSENLLAAQAYGVKGYAPKGTAIEEIVAALRLVAAGETQWYPMPSLRQPIRRRNWLVRTGESGLAQIEATLKEVQAQLDNPQLPLFDWLYWSGRRRELLASRWLVKQLVPIEVVVVPETAPEPKKNSDRGGDLAISPKRDLSRLSLLPTDLLVPGTSPTAIILNNTLAKIQLGIENRTGVPLEIDILQANKKQEIFYLVLDRFRKILEDLRSLNVTREELPQKRSLVLRELLESSLLDFFSQYYTSLDLNANKIIEIFSLDARTIEEEILEKIPMIDELLGYCLFETHLAIDNVFYRSESPEAIARAEIILQNLIERIVNAIVQTILNNFSEIEIIKQNLYQKKYLSSREIARFRNDISWRYRKERYIEEPKNIFESQYRLFFLNGGSLKTTYIYAPRQDELYQLRGIPWLVTIVLELRDALSPRLRAVVGFVGKGVVYLLTQVIGRAIGLIARGIIQGIGNTLQETRYGKNSERGK